ncbi:MAG: response regulator [Deltaproteobacteria bacterium]|nr:response regulator [Deltaproteobacteria bacterium]
MAENRVSLLIVEDDHVDQMAYERFIIREALPYDFMFANSVDSARKILASHSFDLILSDYMLGDGTGLEVFGNIGDAPIIVVTGTGNEETAVIAMKMGASDYLIKDPDGYYLKTLPITVKNALDRKKAEIELKKYKEELEKLVDQRTQKLRESEERYRTLITRMTNGFALQEIICNETGTPCDFRYLEVNSEFEKLTGVAKEEIIGRSALELFPETGTELIRKYGRVALAGVSMHFEHYAERFEKYFDILAYCPEPGQFATIITDVTARKKAEEEKRLLEKQLLQTQKLEALGTLAGGIAHDFNNILSIIFGYIELAQLDITDPAQVSHDLAEMKNAAFRARDLVNHILAMSRRAEEKKHHIRLKDVINEAIKLLKSTIPSTINITAHIDSEKIVFADASQMHQVIMNLCTNAYHSMKVTGGELTIQLSDTEVRKDSNNPLPDMRPGEYIRLTVSDTGHGMDDETMEKIFDPYFTTKGVGEGTGLGLSIVHGIVTSHDGYISVESRKDEGASFTVYIPVAGAIPDDAKAEPEIQRSGSEHLMVIDDETGITDVTSRILKGHGYRVTVFNEGRLAYEEFQKNHESYDMVITDMTMPEMNGLEIAKKMREIDPHKHFIICSGFSDLINKEHLSEEGIYYMAKPVVMGDLMKTIREIFDNRGTQPSAKD